ncbi:MAG: type II toxin-antitoxin system VapC family toxin [Thiomicrospira sp.]|uniref:type II toxin-antitoxin system VapC family toxin n=1 Tax=Thiomicrospira sp. TaxID=935 RepID=UPI0019DED04B|nr:type II toxin-antitoxin system VapC family toxin [Thiomicrospira sp.]MBE0494506.1 type II toxin-antitoxin system VapC family toxin [Thiomicrospira sp.]
MSGLDYLLDTNVVIGVLGRNPNVLELISQHHVNFDRCGYSAISRMELLSFHGLTDESKHAIQLLLDRMHYLPINGDVETSCIAFRSMQKGKLPDAIIAATSLVYELKLLTLDKGLVNKLSQFQPQLSI